jgi:hypothetical protein
LLGEAIMAEAVAAEAGARAGPRGQPNPPLLNGLIWTGAAGFIAILIVSAVFDPTIRWLHAFQALMYLGVIALTARGSRWGLFLGVSVAAFWNYGALFVNSFFRGGVRALSQSLAEGRLVHADQVIAVFAVGFHFLMIAACVAAYLRLPRKSWRDLPAWLATLVGQAAYFAAIMALFQPRYLEQFPRMLHPHGL